MKEQVEGNMTRRVIMSVTGVIICGFSVGLFKRAAFGIDPFQTLMSGLDAVIPISFGTLYVIINIGLLVFSLITDKSKIGIATLINLFLLGYIVDFSQKMLLNLLPDIGIPVRALLLIAGILVQCFSVSLYFTADLGVAPYDAIALVISEKWNPAPFRYCRMTTDLICVLSGAILYILSGQPISKLPEVVGIGTIITAFFMGPLIEYFKVHVAQKLLK